MTEARRVRCWVAYLYATERDAIRYEWPLGPEHAERFAAADEAYAAIGADLERDPPSDDDWKAALTAFEAMG